MGYTHYWTVTAPISDDTWRTICRDARKLLKASTAKVQLEYDDPLPPLVNSEVIRFNGAGDGGYETFILDRRSSAFSFCKTGRAAYDDVVCAILAVATEHAPMIQVSSDGMPEDWEDPVRRASTVLKRPVPIPASVRDRAPA